MNNMISVIIRSMPGRESFLDKCLFILSAQDYFDIEPIIVIQKLTENSDTMQLDEIVNKWKNIAFPHIKILTHVSTSDARSKSLNMGINASSGRFLAFLDDDDKVYPHHYKSLIDILKSSEYAWAYSDIVKADYNNDGQLIARTEPWKRSAYSFVNHLQDNFIPIHAFVIDRSKTQIPILINENLSKLEDYDFLLRLANKHEPFYLKQIGAEYCIRANGTNTVVYGKAKTAEAKLKTKEWDLAREELSSLKLSQIGWWVKEITKPSISSDMHVVLANSTGDIKHDLHKIYKSLTWRTIRAFRRINWMIRGRSIKKFSVPADEHQAQAEFNKIVLSSSWLLFGPIYCIEQAIRKLFNK